MRRLPPLPLAAALAGLTLAASAARAEDLRDLCPDRPLKGFSACSVDQGHWQVESDLINFTHDRSGGVTTDSLVAPNPTLKYGLTDTIDLEASLAPYQRVQVRGGGQDQTASGIGDLVLLSKIHLTGTNGQDGFALVPYVKLPTARHALGNGAVEGGVYAPWQVNLPMNWQLGITPELDLFKNTGDSGRHLSTAASVDLGYQLDPNWNLGFELWGRRDFDPAATTQQWSFDVALAWQPKGMPFAIDAEVDLGLNHNTPGTEFIVGFSRRF